MLVADLHHYLDLAPEVPGPARRLGEHLFEVVRAATAGDTGSSWQSALACRRRPDRSRCPGRMVLLLANPQAPVHWRCGACADEGTISNWAGSPFDLRRRRLALAEIATDVVLEEAVAATLRGLRLLDRDCERTVFRMRAHDDGHALLAAGDAELDGLLDALAAEANAEPNPARRRRLDTAYETLLRAADSTDR